MSQYTQLRMRKSELDDTRVVDPPAGYEVRSYQPGDESAWADIISASFGETKWNVEVTRKELIDRPQFKPKGLFFVTWHGRPVGTCCAWRPMDKPNVGYVHMLGVMPEHQGKGLGHVLVLHVLDYFRKKGFREAILDTDDFRLPAIKTYLKLGFEPVYIGENHRRRWEIVKHKLGTK